MQMRFNSMKTMFIRLWYCLCNPKVQALLRLFGGVGMIFACLDAFADNGNDMLQGTDSSLWATINGTGKKYIYAAEGIVAIGMYIKTKNLMVLSGIVVVAIFINIILYFAGESS